MLMGIGGLVPLPSDALVTPVTFRVKKRNLRGILAKFDEAEDGTRVLSGEWVVGRKTWQRMQTDWKASNKPDVATSKSTGASPRPSSPGRPTPKKKELVVLYIHGGAYYLSSAAAQRIMSIPLAKYTDSRIFALDYRLAPETCFPGPLHDAVSAYLRLVGDLHIPPENIIVCGDSAGGGLSLALLMYLRDNEYPLPSGAILMSPWVDLTMSCESWETNAAYDVVPFPSADNHMNPIALYLGEQTEEYLTHPYASPLFGDFKGLPPLLVQAGDAEVLRDEITLLAHKATLAGVQVVHELYEDAIHVFQAYPFLESSRRSFESMRYFVREVLPRHQSRSPQLLASIAERGLEKEIETDRTVVVSGDGVEVSTPFNKSEFGKEKKALKKEGAGNESSGEDSDPGPSWIPSPALPKFIPEAMRFGSKDKGMVEVEHIENIPDLHLSPPSPSLPTTERPEMRSFTSSTSVLSASSLLVGISTSAMASMSPVPPPNPRRIRSMGSLAAKFSLHFKHHNHVDHPPSSFHGRQEPSSQSTDSSPNPRYSHTHGFTTLNVFASPSPAMSPMKHTRSQSSTILAADVPQNLAMSGIQQTALAAPSIRKRRLSSALSMRHKSKGSVRRDDFFVDPKAGTPSYAKRPSPAVVDTPMDVQTLVDQWTESGPANQTVVVSAAPQHS
ncbi:unnamed protein product [Cyclocybe aegerita]|uniref:Alpha/beta hydrolase fold-3 domain-containing protein n=1 Tax=Cyclocybe aegerita TaxID=1973307 RepID=A0A8S0XJZ0_CYCAE|nr:unnamed protein product [Cyclocybe aegerita]